MPILGYGEDALTLHAISSGIGELLGKLGDTTDPAASVRFFRPSFGRRSSRPRGLARSEFGEFDAIIGTAQAIYLIEAKWSASGGLAGGELELRPAQLRRHVAFRTYLEEWRRGEEASWKDFAERLRPLLIERTLGLVPPSPGTTLATNLEFVLRQLDSCGAEIRNVLLFSRMSLHDKVPSSCGDFSIVVHLCIREEGSNFIRLIE